MRFLHGDAADEALLSAVSPAGWVNPAPASRYNLVVVGGGTAGLVADSDPSSEYQETVNKAKALLSSVEATMTRLSGTKH